LIFLTLRNIILPALPHILTTAALALVERVLAVRFRTRLTRHLTRLYLLGKTKDGKPNYYALKSEGKIDDAGERIVGDADRFAKGLADVGGCLVGPIVDLTGFAIAAYSWIRGTAQGDKV
jgi:ABC-type uncharacterized transport system fused permease/ATPase subunit